jgi:hypothetical protein
MQDTGGCGRQKKGDNRTDLLTVEKKYGELGVSAILPATSDVQQTTQ